MEAWFMKNSRFQGWLSGGSLFKALIATGVFLAAITTSGCGWWKDLTNPPIIDASQQPPGYNQQPAAYDQQPSNYNQQPMAYSRQTASPYSKPPAAQATSDPPAHTTASENPVLGPGVPSQFPALNPQPYSIPTRHYGQNPPPANSPVPPNAGRPAVADLRITEVAPVNTIPASLPATAPKKSATPIPDAKTENFSALNPQFSAPARNASQSYPQTSTPAPASSTPLTAITGLTADNNQFISAAPSPSRGTPAIRESERVTDAAPPLSQPAANVGSSLTSTQPALNIMANSAQSIQPSQPAMPASGEKSTNSSSQPALFTSQPAIASAQPSSPNPQLSSNAAPETLSIQTIQSMLEKYLRQQPTDTNVQLALRYLYQAQGQTDKASEPMKDIPIEQQAEALQFVRTFLLAQQACAPAGRDNPAVIAEALQSIQKLQSRLAENADLEIANLKICQEAARGFGQYLPANMADLESGKTKTLWIYFELRNFQTRTDEQGKFSSRVGAEIALYDEQFRLVKQLLQAEVPDESWNRRTDFYLHAGPLKLPDLAPGKYQLVVNVEDKIAQKAARPARLDFEIKAAKSKSK
jgi:hypothetical protein